MWVSKLLFDMIVVDNKELHDAIKDSNVSEAKMVGSYSKLSEQKAKDDITIDWMRHRINALVNENAVLMNKVTGLNIPVPEIARAGSMTIPAPAGRFNDALHFQDIGDEEAAKQGITNDDDAPFFGDGAPSFQQ
jgi:hypothetical protein